MDSQINAAALALSQGDPLAALKRVSLREDAPALALRGIAMAQLGELGRAKELLRRAQRAFGAREPRSGAARAAFERAEAAARRAAIPALQAEVATARRALEVPAARSLSPDGVRPLLLEQVEALLGSPAFIVDACRRVVRRAGRVVSLT